MSLLGYDWTGLVLASTGLVVGLNGLVLASLPVELS